MRDSLPPAGARDAVIQKMEAENFDPAVVRTFLYYYDQLFSGETSMIHERDIEPVTPEDILTMKDLKAYEAVGEAAVGQCVRIVLNGGLGTGMGLSGAKSLLHVKNGRSFLEIILSQAVWDQSKLCLMNSFNTHQETLSELVRIRPAIEPMMFVQHKYPKILRSDFTPARWPDEPHLEWNPSGHGDIYISLFTSGLLSQLLDQGVRYAMISNSDNLGASLDSALLGFFSEKDLPFMMEVAERLPSDAKGGHLARSRAGRLLLREVAQCPPEEKNAFQDIERYRYFNTNNIWINLLRLRELLHRDGMVKLPMILNPKTLDPRDSDTPPVFQVETAMGAAISLFDGAAAVCVPRARFLPVKTCNELLLLRSDRFVLEKNARLAPNPKTRTESIHIDLDPRWYKNSDDFDARFPQGVPSLVACESMTVRGDILFGPHITLEGSVSITNTGPRQVQIPEGAIADRDLVF